MTDKTLKIRMILAIFINILIIGSSGYGIWLSYCVNGLSILKTFTCISNIIAVLASIVGIFSIIKALSLNNTQIPSWVKTFKYTASVLLLFIFIGFVLLILPNEFFKGNSVIPFLCLRSLLKHIVSPILVLIDFIWFEPAERMEMKSLIFPLAVIALFMIISFILDAAGIITAQYAEYLGTNISIVLSLILVIYGALLALVTSVFVEKLDSHLGLCIH